MNGKITLTAPNGSKHEIELPWRIICQLAVKALVTGRTLDEITYEAARLGLFVTEGK